MCPWHLDNTLLTLWHVFLVSVLFNWVLSCIIFHCFMLIIKHYHTPKQGIIEFNPKIKLNHNFDKRLPLSN